MELNGVYLDELRDFFVKNGEKAFRANQLFTFFHKNGRWDVDNSNLSKKALEIIKVQKISKTEILKVLESKVDETKKFLFELDDANIVEGVLMKYNYGYSQCISTQVGCRMGCKFCASTKAGLLRNLSPGEMLGQVYAAENYYKIKVKNFILMGSGEPMDNFENVIKFLKILHDERGHNTSYRNITISTCGVVSEIYKLSELDMPINLAISLHETNDLDRSAIMPINNRYNLDDLSKALDYYISKTNNRITFEYTLIKGKNDSEKNVRELKNRFSHLLCHINLIPLNPIDEYDEKRPSREDINKFKKLLEEASFNVTIRRELGPDIDGSCGQLRAKLLRGDLNGCCRSN
ncbi:23S rRNA (adenine(2503)-C(2))-methyltransferase RlmN [Peptoniphilus raoultii]|uniref:23S rRNA (adenine(2503)-C(2))-methyltransferase RlmN n=1 Tax=Peptoniphilus raoultii TaxID=1776387 RepID=UPI0008DAF607|nr:23S rRNA (adenine(2503)-C(2))-methyltransferase RlmN [Peptoniphilus raoultii]